MAIAKVNLSSTNLCLDLENNSTMKTTSVKPRIGGSKRSLKQNSQFQNLEKIEEKQFPTENITNGCGQSLENTDASTNIIKLKKPLSSYMRWLTDNREELTISYKENLEPNQKYRSSDFIVYAGSCWRQLPPEERLAYIEQAREALHLYKATIANDASLHAISKPIRISNSSPLNKVCTEVERTEPNVSRRTVVSNRNTTIAKMRLPVANRVRDVDNHNSQEIPVLVVDSLTASEIPNEVCENGNISIHNDQNKSLDFLTENSFNGQDLTIFPHINTKSKSNKKSRAKLTTAI